ncbi:hypothetical protein EHW99_1982 [Erwinia amylovora]|uniref:Uncharacterized protein n=2 Tax=Erwinia amylovora TaxID=552 RepID=A0A831A158_ERWAM|nr:hypothetical protein EaACW_1606 [Erwinia amylovora ACW56400]QJQ54685.1 hypothetical protein EHX00_1982 [Erwinia amylovora]CBA20549.1 hypothetical protein predicted by Glimmer/Critica [Erwinia amylovora CFBP1430]CBJ46253.1 hypothetical protein EAM_1578 [Erwinia amylovora ATCC 49946]CCO78453.1 hypothetical protein BN432_1650 [Erwinia amylovora Ea356]CCO82247.1 hypothetical protein BN433_1672 [Erwinia amylovora Ea266]CCO86035.1 hypothetical protein BN434_1642 [Erwinia amylovora CFBP 2585]CCO
MKHKAAVRLADNLKVVVYHGGDDFYSYSYMKINYSIGRMPLTGLMA